MSTHEDRKVHRVTSEADARIRAYAREKGITAFDAASMWQPPAEPSEHGAESVPDVLADPRVIKFAADKGITPAAAVEWMIDRAARRAANLATYAANKRASR